MNSQKIRRKHQREHKEAKERLLGINPYCCWCNCPLDDTTVTLEHLVPIIRGGKEEDSNYEIACRACNNNRRAKLPGQVTPPFTKIVWKGIRYLENRGRCVTEDALIEFCKNHPVGRQSIKVIIKKWQDGEYPQHHRVPQDHHNGSTN